MTTTKSTKEVRGWLGVEHPAPRMKLDLSDEGYNEQSLSVDEQNALNAKMTLLTCQKPDQPSFLGELERVQAQLYEHISDMLSTVLVQNPDDPVEHVESMSAVMKTTRMRTEVKLKDVPDPGHNAGQARAEWSLFKTIARTMPNAEPGIYTSTEKDEEFVCLPNLMRQAHLFNMAGLGLQTEYYVRVTLALRELAKAWPFISLRFWGVIHGLHGDYTIAEGELGEGDYETDVSDDEELDEALGTADDKENGMFDDMSEDIKPMYTPPKKIPCEHAGVGVNRKVYFVCSQPGTQWARLPHVTPAQIQAARQIKKYFTGNLDHKMTTFPPFPGTERNYLRAQIARISAASHVSPIGVFKFDEDEEEEEAAEGARDTCVVDLDFEGVNMKDLNDPSLMSWVHHAPYILPQGRTTWYNVAHRLEGEEAEDEEIQEEERNEPDEPEPQAGPPLLTPLAEDAAAAGDQPAWIARPSTRLVPEYALATVQSVVWPGAVAVAADNGRFFENLYVGWGQKKAVEDFQPGLPEPAMDEFPTGPEVIEAEDPSPETEAAIRAAMTEQENARKDDDELEDGIIDDDEDGGPDLSD